MINRGRYTMKNDESETVFFDIFYYNLDRYLCILIIIFLMVIYFSINNN